MKKQRLTARLQGNEFTYRYVSFGRQCGNVYEKLRALEGQRVTFYHSPQLKKPLLSDDYYAIYGIETTTRNICSYGDISSMRQHSNSIGLLSSTCMIVISLITFFRRGFSIRN